MKALFQPLAFGTLALCCLLTLYWAFTGTGVYAWIGARIGTRVDDLSLFLTLYLTFWVPFTVWIGVMLVLRRLTNQPSIRLGLSEWKQNYAQESAKNEKLYATPAHAYTPAMRRRVRFLGGVFVAVGIACLTGAALSLIVSLAEGRIYSLQILLAVLGLFFVGGGVYQFITGRTVVRRNREA